MTESRGPNYQVEALKHQLRRLKDFEHTARRYALVAVLADHVIWALAAALGNGQSWGPLIFDVLAALFVAIVRLMIWLTERSLSKSLMHQELKKLLDTNED